jgi:DNA-binding LytR/AlgR family response regulator
VFGALISRLNQIKFIEFGNNKIAQDEVVYLQALEHHVKMVTKSSEHVHRARLKDVIQILADVDGIQPHRSYWVPKQAILWAGQDAQALSLYTENHVIPVAGTRRVEIEKWLNDNQIEIRTAPLSSH